MNLIQTKRFDIKESTLFFYMLMASIYYAGWYIQCVCVINRDVSWNVYMAQEMLSGGQYVRDFFDVTPPSVFYLYLIPAIFIKYFGTPLSITVRIYVFLLSTFSLYYCYFLLKKIFSTNDQMILQGLTLVLGMIFFIVPGTEFAQRDYLMIILMMPYLFLVAYRLEQKNAQITLKTEIISGLCAGAAFSIKPFFLIMPCLIELYYLYHTKKLLSIYRRECIAMSAFIIAYAFYMLLFQSTYLEQVVPLLFSFYYQCIHSSLKKLLTIPLLLSSYLSILFGMISLNHPYRQLNHLLCVAALGSLSCYLMQQTLWLYHLLPLLSYCLLIVSLSLIILIRYPLKKENIFLFFLLITLSIGSLYYTTTTLWEIIRSDYIFSYMYLFFSILSLLYLGQRNKPFRIYETLLTSGISAFLISYSMYLAIRFSFWQAHFFLIALLIMLVLFLIILYLKQYTYKMQMMIAIILGNALLIIPCFVLKQYYVANQIHNHYLSKIIDFIRDHAAHQRINYFSTKINSVFPQIFLGGALPGSRLPHLAFMPILLKKNNELKGTPFTKKQCDGQAFYLKIVTEDFQKYSPAFVFVHKNDFIRGPSAPIGIERPIDYIKFFSQSATFKKLWRQYHYLKTITLDDTGDKIDVYEKK